MYLDLALVLCLLAVFLSGFSDMATYIGNPISLMGIGTLIVAGLGLTLWLRHASIPGASRLQVGFATFLLFELMMVPFSLPSSSGAQNLAVFAGMTALIFIASRLVALKPESAERLRRAFLAGLAGGAVLYAVLLVRDGLGSNTLIGARSFGITAVLGLAHLAAGWRYGSRHAGLAAFLLLALIAASLSRTTLVVGLIVLLLAWAPIGRKLVPWLRFGVMVGALYVLALAVWTYVPGLQDRFLAGDTTGLSIGGVGINAEGRVNFWTTTWESFLTSPLLGHGAGSVEQVMLAAYGDVNISHPHNDYLRLLHDYGVIGAILWLSTWFITTAKLYKNWRECHFFDRSQAAVLSSGAFLSMIGTSVVMLTDNIVIYPFAMFPLAVMTGVALAVGQEAVERPDR